MIAVLFVPFPSRIHKSGVRFHGADGSRSIISPENNIAAGLNLDLAHPFGGGCLVYAFSKS